MNNETDTRARLVLEAAHKAWQRLAPVRERRQRYCRYTYGDQWSDPVRRRDGTVTTEGEKALEAGHTPLSNNLIRRMVKAVVGRYRTNGTGNTATNPASATGITDTSTANATAANPNPTATTFNANPGAVDHRLQQQKEFNSLDEVDARTLEEFLISGMAIHHVWRENRPGGNGVWVDNVCPDNFFINNVSNSRCTDMELVGQLLDMSLGEVVMRFAHGSKQRARQLRELYGTVDGDLPTESIANRSGQNFFHSPTNRCRVIEVWTLECREGYRCHDPLRATYTVVTPSQFHTVETENRRRRSLGLSEIASQWQLSTTWHCRMMAPDGTLLDEYDSPMQGGVPPFAVKLYPMVDGTVHSLVEDVIEQQRYVNRLISLMDRMMGTAAKGVLLYPTGCKPDGQRWDEVAKMWSDPGGVIPYRPFQGTEPHQVVTPVADIGAQAMLKTQMQMFEDVSGVTEALLGKAGTGVVGVDRYESQVRNASVTVSDLLLTFQDFVKQRDKLIIKII
jgi:hypothetical protein